MAIIVYTQKPQTLLDNIKKAIDNRTVDTWEYDKDGDFTHTPAQWKNKAWLRPSVSSGVLQFDLIWPKGSQQDKTIYGVYHGRFIEMLLTHFDAEFSSARAPK